MNTRKVVASRRIEENTVTVETSGPEFEHLDNSAEAVLMLNQLGATAQKADELLHAVDAVNSNKPETPEPIKDEHLELHPDRSVLFKIPTSPSKTPQGKSLQRRNREVKERQITVITSKRLKTAHVTIHIGYTNRSPEGAKIFARNDLSKQKITYDLSQAPDLEVHVYPEKYEGSDIIDAKSRMYKKYMYEGWNMVGQVPKDPVLVSLATATA